VGAPPTGAGYGRVREGEPAPAASLHDLSAGGGVLERIDGLARRAVVRFGWSSSAQVELLNLSENATYLVGDDEGRRAVLRVHRLGYHTRTEIESELAWMEALRIDAGVRTPRVLAAPDGSRLISLPDPSGDEERFCVMLEFLAGRQPVENDLGSLERLGEITAVMHGHTEAWAPPAGFRRFHWDYEAAFGASARWGRWQDGAGVGLEEAAVLTRLDEVLRSRLDAFGKAPERYGLVHADTRLANLLVDDEGGVSLIDFDDCGFGWRLYDLATAFSFFEHEPQVPELIDAWLTGYRRVRPLGAAEEAQVWTFILFRRLLLVAWIGSHGAVEVARQLGSAYTLGTCELAEGYLRRDG